MTVSVETGLQSFVLLRLGERRFALAAERIAELVPPSRVATRQPPPLHTNAATITMTVIQNNDG